MPTPPKSIPTETAVERLERLNREAELLREEIQDMRTWLSWAVSMNAGMIGLISDLCATIEQPYAAVRNDMIARVQRDILKLPEAPSPVHVDV